MSKREKIIVILMLLALVVGGYDFFFRSGPSQVTPETALPAPSVDSFVQDISANLARLTASQNDAHIIKAAQQAWEQDPFTQLAPASAAGPDPEETLETENLADEAEFVYAGFVEMGPQRLAVINGMEYAVGEELEPGGYVLEQILPAQVEIFVRDMETSIVIPLQETE
jgi:hypothetical protein